MNVEPWVWAATIAALATIITIDLIVVDRRPHEFTSREAARWVAVYVALAVLFSLLLLVWQGPVVAGEFVAGYVTEYSLSVDNLFVFLVIMASFQVPRVHQHRVLLIGIVIALILRAILIVIGAAAIERFAATFFVFAAFLLWTARSVWRSQDSEPDLEGNALVRVVERLVPTTREYHGTRLTIRSDGRIVVTPMLLVMLAIGTTDLLFALDSIPAVFGLTREPYIVFTANAFALMGLRQLFFLLHGLLDRVIYLSKGLAVILGFIGIKLLLEALHGTTDLAIPEIPIWLSLGVIMVVLLVTVLASLLAVRRDPSLARASAEARAEDQAAAHEGEALTHLDEPAGPSTTGES